MTNEEYYESILKKAKSLPEERKHLFLFGERQEYSRISYVKSRLMKETPYKIEAVNACNCSNVWNITITVRS